ncbi:MAG: hypothetical protein A2487_18020 [Candidatus Raymondbacteria bacterium RifOxyC12_full_50_8]|uniref:Uncharacterized protein n=1 Tax=Candidatus Raymondbacteria bacterium RIFOXYD12_FULL_49_13 TaxID=1817890 RepID=A0A1F7FH73_UNCRA|nr:MAG: hypothetical protein A2248_05020 [Candidatus Raymondbacteria bacterium RIFOXYA2_FULL_49_16]OGJ99265.1 MAG: hypothetical protein A2350_05320 [Candidatus Raymondbacteria bacterium RifOxyB12_full_50_8]OGK04749.1 MAG: hypothetical protein A2487_18020 [Candidatus Raymondbacteria bacterium RifOxyC12_full_50_8]OGK05857.1 MAG: hypothetical protein A2519_04195 [Candidatus Raymondbacteria bacterium RIFOXYD12_FULL_49_13]OGP43351.1 MAG: hypothetical protein A2324_02660 [Candidatus Raymondbacteria b
MKLLDFIICDDVRQEVGDKFTLVGMYSDVIQMHLKGVKEIKWPVAMHLAMFTRFLYEKTDEKPDSFRIEFILEGKPLSYVEGNINLPADTGILNINSVMNPFFFTNQGVLSFIAQFKKDGKTKIEIKPEYKLEIKVRID